MKKIFDEVSAQCSQLVTKRYSTSFSLGIRFLGKELREPIYSIYGFVRLADEIVDSFHDYDKEAMLGKLKRECFEALEEQISINPILNAFQAVVNRYQIERELIELFLESMEMDLLKNEYTPKKYKKYILGSAQVVGLMCLRVFTNRDNNAYSQLKPSAMMLGSAFQKVNFLRDISDDYSKLSRSYFPGVDIPKFSNREKLSIEKEISDEFNSALEGIKLLPASSRNGVYLAYTYYKKLFDKIRRKDSQAVLQERIRISNFKKFLLMCNASLRYKANKL
ncbi:phytoene/squalene synthase family protein [Pedobacter sp. Leaf194]|uniref:phytoene/squalene synthase family protein n=1 Tax=Pedobacter sp. Leaf194 TaxID=1736297 RepID=UPI0007031D35|nr:phytoene/squalene synthase family protein [Pedobacter sp. Leaf194]KQS36304.1 phytoene synthase [Pedobacter sp. Leaf194]